MAAKRGVRPGDVYLLKTVMDPQVSPDGLMVAYVVVGADKDDDETRTAVWVAPINGRAAARRFTQGKKDHSPRWSPDGRSLAFVSDRGEKSQVFVAPLAGGEARQVTKAKWGVSSPAWSPDGTRIAYAARTGEWKEPKERKGAEKSAPRVIRDLRYKLDGIGFFDERRMHIFVVEIEPGTEKQLTNGDYYEDQPSWSPDGKTIAFVADRERARNDRQFRSDVWAVPAKGGRAVRLSRAKGGASIPTYSPDGKWLAYVGHEHGDDIAQNTHLLLMPAKGGAPRSLSAALDRPVTGWPPYAGKTIAWEAGSKSLLFLAGDRGRISMFRADLRGKATPVLDGERQIEAFQLAPNGEQVAFVALWPSRPGEAYSASLKNGRRELNLSHANDELLAAAEFVDVKRMTHRAPDGTEIESFLMYPRGYERGKRYPLAINVHGGPHSMHPGSRAMLEFQSLAAAGYVVMLPNPRGSTTYGDAFAQGCVRDWGGGDYVDILTGVDALIRRGVVDTERQFIGGYSYGGFMSAWAVGHTDRFKAAVVGAPVANQLSSFGTCDIPLFDVHEIGGLPQENLDVFVERSPIAYLNNATTPVLLLHHEGDLRCPIGQSEEIFHALKAYGKEVEFVRYPGGFHTYATHAPSQAIDRMTRTLAWFDGHGGRVRQAVVRKPKVKVRG